MELSSVIESAELFGIHFTCHSEFILQSIVGVITTCRRLCVSNQVELWVLWIMPSFIIANTITCPTGSFVKVTATTVFTLVAVVSMSFAYALSVLTCFQADKVSFFRQRGQICFNVHFATLFIVEATSCLWGCYQTAKIPRALKHFDSLLGPLIACTPTFALIGRIQLKLHFFAIHQ